MKAKPCKYCGSAYHTSLKCFQRPQKPLRPEAVKTREKRLSTNKKWFKRYKPDKYGFWYCYLQISPRCPKRLTEATLVLEHVKSKTRHPGEKFNRKNLKPACEFCNELKGSLDVNEVK